MTKANNEIFVRIALIFSSIIISLLIFEYGLKYFLPEMIENQDGLDSYFPRYFIDEKPSVSIDYYRSDQQLPFVLEPSYQKSIVDIAFHPEQWTVSLDEHGYRNPKNDIDKYDLVIVGDSVAFGYGLNDEDTISSKLKKHKRVYSLAIPNAGPEMYMVMLERFFKRAKARQVAILYYEGNDYKNIENATWKNLRTCSFPDDSLIIRKDTPFLTSTIELERNPIYLIQLANDILKKTEKIQDFDLCKLIGVYSQVSTAAITDLDNYINYEEKLVRNSKQALSYLSQLSKAPCVERRNLKDIENITRRINDNNYENLSKDVREFTTELIKDNCYPLGEDYVNKNIIRSLLYFTNYHAGYYYDWVSSLRNNYYGNLVNYKNLLRKMKNVPKLEQYGETIEKLLEQLESKNDLLSIKELTGNLKEKLVQEASPYCTFDAPKGCDKKNLFLDYLKTLKSKNISVTIFTTPSELSLNYPRNNEENICKEAEEKLIRCIDLFPLFSEHYGKRVASTNGLFLDGAHLSKSGSSQVAHWISESLNLH